MVYVVKIFFSFKGGGVVHIDYVRIMYDDVSITHACYNPLFYCFIKDSCPTNRIRANRRHTLQLGDED